MASDSASYAPGWTPDAVEMMASRTAVDRAGTVLAHSPVGARVLDVGCGPGTITVGLAEALGQPSLVFGLDAEISQVSAGVARGQVAEVGNVRFEVGSALALPHADHSVDVYFSHALYEHLGDPFGALAEARRVLRPMGLLVIAASDWSSARFDPYTADVEAALQGHRLLRRRAGGNPDAGRFLAQRVSTAGFVIDQVQSTWRGDMSYSQLATYIAVRLAHAQRRIDEREDSTADDQVLIEALAAARRWEGMRGTWTQCWTEVTARPASAEP